MNDKLLRVWNNPKRTPLLIGLIAFNAGAGLGYFLGMRRKSVQVHNPNESLNIRLNVNDLVKVREAAKRRRGTVVIPPITASQTLSQKEAAEVFIEETLNDIRIVPSPDREPVELVTKSIFDDDDWDYAVETPKRSEDAPYILHKDEFYGEERDYSQVTLTYYAGDNIMCDQEDSPIYNYEQITGPLRFGHGSGDPNVVHIRNDKMRAEYEILFDPGLYSVEVLGLQIENNTRVQDLKHSKHTKFREE